MCLPFERLCQETHNKRWSYKLHLEGLERKRKNLIRLGIEQGQAYAWSRTRMGGWAVAQSPILGTTITLSRLRSLGSAQ